MLAPEAHAAVQATRNRHIGLLATAATVASKRYDEAVHALDAGAQLTAVACPDLVPLIESGAPTRRSTRPCANTHGLSAKQAVDTVILGCTHYPLIRPVFERVFARGDARLLGGGDRPRGRRDAGAQGDRERPARQGGAASGRRASRRSSARSASAFSSVPIGDVEQVSRSASSQRRGRGMSRKGDARTSSGPSRSSPTSSSRRTGRRSSRSGRRGCSAPRPSRTACRAGSRDRSRMAHGRVRDAPGLDR